MNCTLKQAQPVRPTNLLTHQPSRTFSLTHPPRPTRPTKQITSTDQRTLLLRAQEQLEETEAEEAAAEKEAAEAADNEVGPYLSCSAVCKATYLFRFCDVINDLGE